jgi:hypothetical protein
MYALRSASVNAESFKMWVDYIVSTWDGDCYCAKCELIGDMELVHQSSFIYIDSILTKSLILFKWKF